MFDNQTAPGPHLLRTVAIRTGWAPALLHAAPISAFVLLLFYHWYAVADRYVIFLYNHMGATPFDDFTSGRYWMAGLVAAGAVMALYTTANWFAARIRGLRFLPYCPPDWRRVWLLAAVPLIVGIPAITMSVNSPTLPMANAAACTLAAVAGLALALLPSRLAAEAPSELAWPALGGAGLAPALLLLRTPELPASLIAPDRAWAAAAGGLALAIVWLALFGLLSARRGPPVHARSLFLAGLTISYLLLPLAHFLLLTPPGVRYISAASNFFANNLGVQFLVFGAAALLAVAAAHGERRLRRLSRSMGRTL